MIDLHIHGVQSVDTNAEDPESIIEMASFLAKEGIKAFLPAVYPSPIERMRKAMGVIKKAMDIQCQWRGNSKSPLGASGEVTVSPHSEILGVYLEGPFLNPEYAGALDRSSFIPPSGDDLMRLIDGYEEIVRIITIAPELPGATAVIERAVQNGIKVHMGHSGATYKEAMEGKKAGATGITHLFNALRPIHHREPGIAGLGLLDEELYVELICDGIHICPEILRLVFFVKPVDRIIAVSDGIIGSGLSVLSGEPAVGAGYTTVTSPLKDGRPCGSLYTLSKARKVLRDAGLPDVVIEMVTEVNPSQYLQLSAK